MEYKMNFSLENLKHIYVTSYKAGFLAIADDPMCVTTESGSSSNHIIISVKRVIRDNGEWVYARPDTSGEWWMKKAWDQALALTGAEPWRVYRLDADEVARLLDAGEFTDDVRGFSNRGEPWQPISVNAEGQRLSYEHPTKAAVWERRDGWRVVLADGAWVADGSRCNAARSTLLQSPRHFDPIEDLTCVTHIEAISAVDEQRPFN